MNEKGVAALVDAGMRGVRQIKYVLADGRGGFCAGGVLIEAFRARASRRWRASDLYAEYAMTEDEWSRMVELNNDEGLDFIAIARKLGPDS